MLPLSQIESKQIPLIHIVHEDDIVLLNTPEADWFRVLYYFPWEKYRIFGAEYYDGLYEFNKREERKRQEKKAGEEEEILETKEDARQRLLFERVTACRHGAMQVEKPCSLRGKSRI